MAKDVQYPYAFDENNQLVFVEDIEREKRHDHTYHCPCCGHPMLPRLGDSNAKHFYHSDNHKCGVESYIHAAAKRIIARKFNENDSFYIGLNSERLCKDKNHCPEEDTWNCYVLPVFARYDLKRYYDLPPEIEVDIVEPDGETHYRPDVLLRSSNPKRRDIFIEINYKHKSDSRKLESGHQIIEIKVREMADLLCLAEMESIDESKDIRFIGFKPLGVTPSQIMKEQKEDHELNDHPYRYYDYPPCIRRIIRNQKGQ